MEQSKGSEKLQELNQRDLLGGHGRASSQQRTDAHGQYHAGWNRKITLEAEQQRLGITTKSTRSHFYRINNNKIGEEIQGPDRTANVKAEETKVNGEGSNHV